jgi:hypothetical protein
MSPSAPGPPSSSAQHRRLHGPPPRERRQRHRRRGVGTGDLEPFLGAAAEGPGPERKTPWFVASTVKGGELGKSWCLNLGFPIGFEIYFLTYQGKMVAEL